MAIDCNPLASEVSASGDGSGATNVPVGAGVGTGALTGGSATDAASVAGAVFSSSSSTSGSPNTPGDKAVIKLDWGVRGTVFLVLDGLQDATGKTQKSYSPGFLYNATAIKSSEIASIDLMISTNWRSAPSAIVRGVFKEVNVYQFDLPGQLVIKPGPYRAQWVARTHGGEVIWLRHAWVEWKANNLAAVDFAPVSIDDMRAFMLDQTPAQNSALNALEFSDFAILEGLAQAVDYFNSQPPRIDGVSFSPVFFPWGYQLKQGTAAQLLRTAARNKMRNEVDVNAGGVQVNFEVRWKNYETVGKEMWTEFQRFTQVKRNEIDMNMCYGWTGSFSSAYGC